MNVVVVSTISILMITILLFMYNSKEKYLESFSLSSAPNQDTVWTYWEPYPPPKMVQMCYDNWRRIGQVNDIRILHPNNITRYVPENEYNKICQNAENPAVKSDFILFYLLNKFGGTWIDGSVFLNKPLFEWLPRKNLFCYRADRFSVDTICMETFFMYSPKGHPLSSKWYDMLHKVSSTIGKDQFVANTVKKYPYINDLMSEDNYLWVYVVGKYILHENPGFLSLIDTRSAEEGPWYEAERHGWENVDQICSALSRKEPCPNCPLTKIHNGMREQCGIEVVP